MKETDSDADKLPPLCTPSLSLSYILFYSPRRTPAPSSCFPRTPAPVVRLCSIQRGGQSLAPVEETEGDYDSVSEVRLGKLEKEEEC
ncbi:hypothetical protein E2C01_099639 [Portunus trituberculatus]|uniref:Uncharacterized protein n=1 Tax=Portunus trituberculatus TaxID=210409 RepID=A0A5B7KBF7_PORTR|nr:hypothetical protein [Portunus trituberculatus]